MNKKLSKEKNINNLNEKLKISKDELFSLNEDNLSHLVTSVTYYITSETFSKVNT